MAMNFLWIGSSIAQQVSNSGFEDWSGATFDGNIQPAVWNACNVTQIGFKFNFAHREAGHTGNYSFMVQDQEVGAAGITEVSPGYFSLGTPWVYVESLLKVSEATAGDNGGIAWTWRPDTLAVWIRRTGNNALKEDFHILYYSWKGTSTATRYKGKNGNCTSVTKNDEESDIRQATDANECGTAVKASQIAEGWLYDKAIYNDWTLIKVPILYCSDEAPEKMNMIFSASNYPNFRANSGLYDGNSLYVDDVELIYSSKIQHLYIDGKEWRGFDPQSCEEQVYCLDENATALPAIQAMRGEGSYTNSKGEVATYIGRRLQSSEMTITPGQIDGDPTLITVRSEDGSSTTTYKIKFVHAASTNALLSSIAVNGKDLTAFQANQTDYWVELPYGTTAIPTITALGQEDAQTITIDAPTSLTTTATITVTAADQTTQMVYTLRFRIAALADNTLQNILVNSQSLPGFNPTQTVYRVSLPISTTQMPVVQAVSAYPEGEQTITYTAPSQIDGGTYLVAVSTPGNPTPKTYKLTFKLEASSYTYLRDLQVGEGYLYAFDPEQLTYYVTLPMGTTTLPAITYTPGDSYQTIDMVTAGIDGTTRITVTAGNGVDKSVYKIVFTTPKSSISTLNGIRLNGQLLPSFHSDSTYYEVQLPVGTTSLPAITVDKGDEYQSVTIVSGGLNGKTRITVTAGDGSVTMYQIAFSVDRATDTTLQMIYLNGDSLANFDPQITQYDIDLPQGVQTLPTVTYTPHDSYQIITCRTTSSSVMTITVRAQDGSTRMYTLHFTIYASANTQLAMIYLNHDSLPDFDPAVTSYTYTLPQANSAIPTVTYTKQESVQRVISTYERMVQTLEVTAQNGEIRTYTITFVAVKSQNAQLNMIYLNGDSLSGFDPENLYYNCILATPTCPVITVDRLPSQQVSISMPYADGVARIQVTPEQGASQTYEIQFTDTTKQHGIEPVLPYQSSTCVALTSIQANGVEIPGFQPQQHTYELTLPAGTDLPTITWVPSHPMQSVLSGPCSANTFRAVVRAENGDTAQYEVHCTLLPYTDATLSDLHVEGMTPAFDPLLTTYTVEMEKGTERPLITYLSRPGQTLCVSQWSDTLSVIMVRAQNGNEQTYRIVYRRTLSSDTRLRDLQINGVTIAHWNPEQLHYVDTLAWRSTVVPDITAIGQVASQTITTHYSSVNSTTQIHVQAENGAERTYTIAFPVYQSTNTTLQDVYLDTEAQVAFDFQPQITDYTIILPYHTPMAPRLIYETMEPEQQVRYISRPMGQTSELQVMAQNGDTLTYRFLFTVDPSPLPNELADITIGESHQPLTLLPGVYDYTVELPYGSTSMTVTYTKQFEEQSVILIPGNAYTPAKLMVSSNRVGDPDVVYTLTPHLPALSPAVLLDLTVNNVSIPSFSPERLAYVVPVVDSNIVRPTPAPGATYNVTIHNNKHWQAEVTCDNDTSVYDIYFFYTHDEIPNPDFTQWENAAYKGTKPVGWNTLGQFTEGATLKPWGTYTTGEEVTQSSEGVVKMVSEYNYFPLGGFVPGYITLGNINATFSVAAGSDFAVTGGITFRNTPDSLLVNYKSTKLSNNASRIVYTLQGDLGTQSLVHTTTSTMSSFQTLAMDLTPLNATIGIPQTMNIILNSFESEQGRNGTEAQSAEMYVDWVRPIYNHHLQSVYVDDQPAQCEGNTYRVTLSTPSYNLPHVHCEGQVSDQVQHIVWNEPVIVENQLLRTATITNYAEDGSSEDYALQVLRPLDTQAQLQCLRINGQPVPNWNPMTYDYTYDVSVPTCLPDIEAVPASPYQTISATASKTRITYTVTPQYGQAVTYTILLNPVLNSDTTLASITEDEQRFTAFTKSSDTQIVEMTSLQQGNTILSTITVTAQDGTQGHYTKRYDAPIEHTSGRLAEILLDGNLPADFAPTVYEYTKPQPSATAFIREYEQDSVIYTQTPHLMKWQVYGDETHTYTLHFSTQSSSTTLQGITINSQLLEGFSPLVHEYTYATNDPVIIEVTPSHSSQYVHIDYQQSVYTITVTAADGTVGMPYTLTLTPQVGTEATLDSLLICGQNITAFRSDSLYYTYEIPTPQVKEHQPALPSITYVPTSPHAHVQVLPGGLNEITYIAVTSEDGHSFAQYELMLTAEKSHNALLSALYVNDIEVPHFEPARHYYAVTSNRETNTVVYRTQDRFSEVTMDTLAPNNYLLRVVAEDGMTTEEYHLEILQQTLSDNATLQMIWLNGRSMETFERALNPNLTFSSLQNTYLITLPQATTRIPDISASLMMEGQSIAMDQDNMTAYIHVTAPDGVTTNTYTLHFLVSQSKNTDLSMIYLNGDSLSGFDPHTQYYRITLPMYTTSLPTVQVQKGDAGQQTVITSTASTTTITVTAEDTTCHFSYILAYDFVLSSTDTLSALYEDDMPLPGFDAHTYNYTRTLPVGTSHFPFVSWDLGDAYQQVQADTIVHTSTECETRYTVTAQNGQKSVYHVHYTITLSDVDTLQMIYINSLPLTGFQAQQIEYAYSIPSDMVSLPAITWLEADAYQSIQLITMPDPTYSSHALGQKAEIHVTAQNGQTRIYTLHFPYILSSNAHLTMIKVGGQNVAGFEETETDYVVTLPYGTTGLPAVTVTRYESSQNVDITMTDSLAIITVTAQDGITTLTYTLHWQYRLSDDASLTDIYADSVLIPGYVPTQHEYIISLPYGQPIPTLSWTMAVDGQKVCMDSTMVEVEGERHVTYLLSVTSPSGEYSTEYTIQFICLRSSNARLAHLMVRGIEVGISSGFDIDFQTDSLIYSMAHPIGTASEAFFTPNDVTFVTQDSNATVTITAMEGTTYQIRVTVTAHNGIDSRTYILRQWVTLSDEGRVAVVYLDNERYAPFSPDIHTYEYYLYEGMSAPLITFELMDAMATAYPVTPGVVDSLPWTIIGEAQDGTTQKYEIYFRYASINTASQASANDVLVQPIPGTLEVAAATLRDNVSIAFYTRDGRCVAQRDLPVANYNNVVTVISADGREQMVRLTNLSDAEHFTLRANEPYLYVFYSERKTPITSGKLMLQR